MSLHQTVLWASEELYDIINDMQDPFWREKFCKGTLELRLREIRGALRYDLKVPDNCQDCEGLGGKTLDDGCYQICFSCDGTGKKTIT